MSFLSDDSALIGAQPVEMYHFQIGGFNRYYTSDGGAHIYSGITFLPSQGLKRGPINQSNEGKRENVTITLPGQNAVSNLYLNSSPQNKGTVKIYRRKRAASDVDTIQIFSGRIYNTIRRNRTMNVQCETFLAIEGDTFLAPKFSAKCNHTIYDTGCGLNRESLEIVTTVTSINPSKTILATTGAVSVGTDYLRGGLLRTIQNEFSMISAHNDLTGELTLFEALPSLEPNDSIFISPGCLGDPDICESLGNYDNFFGFEHMPVRTIFSGGTLLGDV